MIQHRVAEGRPGSCLGPTRHLRAGRMHSRLRWSEAIIITPRRSKVCLCRWHLHVWSWTGRAKATPSSRNPDQAKSALCPYFETAGWILHAGMPVSASRGPRLRLAKRAATTTSRGTLHSPKRSGAIRYPWDCLMSEPRRAPIDSGLRAGTTRNLFGVLLTCFRPKKRLEYECNHEEGTDRESTVQVLLVLLQSCQMCYHWVNLRSSKL